MPTPRGDTARPSQLVLWGALLVLYFVWGSTYLAIRLVVETMPPFLSAGVRFLAAGVIVIGWLVLRRGVTAIRIGTPELVASAVVGAALLLGGNGLVSAGERDVPSGLAALLVAAVPLYVVVLRAFAGERPSRVGVAGVAVGFAGVAVLVLPTGIDGTVAPFGMALILIASASWATGSFVSRRLRLPSDPLVSTGFQLLCGGAFLVIAGIGLGEATALDVSRFSSDSLIALGYLVLAGSVLAYTAYTWLLQNAPIARVATYAYVNPVVAVALGWAFLAEEVTALTLAGAALILVAVAVIVRTENRSTPSDAVEESPPVPSPGESRA